MLNKEDRDIIWKIVIWCFVINIVFATVDIALLSTRTTNMVSIIKCKHLLDEDGNLEGYSVKYTYADRRYRNYTKVQTFYEIPDSSLVKVHYDVVNPRHAYAGDLSERFMDDLHFLKLIMACIIIYYTVRFFKEPTELRTALNDFLEGFDS